VAISMKLMVESEKANISILERLIFFLHSEFKNASKYLENKNSDYLKLLKMQKEKDAEFENEINNLKPYKDRELQNSLSFKLEKQSLEDEIKELKDYGEKIKKDYETDIRLLKSQNNVLTENLTAEKKKSVNLVEESKYKDTIIDDKEKSIAQLLNQISEADTEAEHTEKLRKELTLMQNDLFNTQKKLKQSNNSEQDLMKKIIALEETAAIEKKEKETFKEDFERSSKELDNLKKESDSFAKEKGSLANEQTELKNKLNEAKNKVKYLEEKIVDLSTNNTNSKSSIESANKKIAEMETKLILISKEKSEALIKFENEIRSLKITQNKEIESIKASQVKEIEIVRLKHDADLEKTNNNFVKQLESVNTKSKSVDEKFTNVAPFLSSIFGFYEESEGMVITNQTNVNVILERFGEIKLNFSQIESSISELTIEDESITKNRMAMMKNNNCTIKKVESGSNSEREINKIDEKARNFEKIKEKVILMLSQSNDILSKTNLRFVNLDKIKRKLIKSKSTSY
jgi:chromosome segregation ATPase